ncbi:hypothetical protein D3C75_1019810 [compost metagenome]
MGVENAHRMLIGGAVIAEHQVQLELSVAVAAGNGCNGVMGNGCPVLTGRLSQNIRSFVSVAPPRFQKRISQNNQLLFVLTGDAHHRHGPFHAADFHTGICIGLVTLLYRRLFHGEHMPSALEVVMA